MQYSIGAVPRQAPRCWHEQTACGGKIPIEPFRVEQRPTRRFHPCHRTREDKHVPGCTSPTDEGTQKSAQSIGGICTLSPRNPTRSDSSSASTDVIDENLTWWCKGRIHTTILGIVEDRTPNGTLLPAGIILDHDMALLQLRGRQKDVSLRCMLSVAAKQEIDLTENIVLVYRKCLITMALTRELSQTKTL